MDDNAKLLQALQELSSTIRNMQSISVPKSGPRSRNDDYNVERSKNSKKIDSEQISQMLQMKRQSEIYRQSLNVSSGSLKVMKRLEKSSSALSDMTDLANKTFQDMIDDFDTKSLKKATSLFKNTLENSGKAYAKSMSNQIKSVEDWIRIKGRFDKDSISNVMAIKAGYKSENITRAEAVKQLKALGYSADALRKSQQTLESENKDLALSLAKTKDSVSDPTSFSKIKGMLGKVVGVAEATRPMVDTARSAMRTGTQMEFGVDSALLGMSPQELNELQASNRQYIGASGTSFDQYNKKLRQGYGSMVGYVGDPKEIAAMTAKSLKNARTLGVSDESLYVTQQQELYKRLNTTLSMTASEFAELNDRLINSSDVQDSLFKIDKKSRAAKLDELQLTYEKLRYMGFEKEAATQMIESMSHSAGKTSAKDRFGESAKLQMVAGALGLGSAGKEMAAIHRRGYRNKGDYERFAQLSKTINAEISKREAGNEASQMGVEMLLEKSGIEHLLTPGRAGVLGENNRINPEIAKSQTMSDTARAVAGSASMAFSAVDETLKGPILKTLQLIAASIVGAKALDYVSDTFKDRIGGGSGGDYDKPNKKGNKNIGKRGKGGRFGKLSNAVSDLSDKVRNSVSSESGMFNKASKFINESGIKSEASKMLGVGKGMIKGSAPIALISGGLDIASNDNPNLSMSQKIIQAGVTGLGGFIGGIGGGTIGVLGGPVGAGAGMLGGGAIGSHYGQQLGRYLTGDTTSELYEKNDELITNINDTKEKLKSLSDSHVSENDDTYVKTNEELSNLLKEQVDLQKKILEATQQTTKNTSAVNDSVKEQTEQQKAAEDEKNKKDNNGFRLSWLYKVNAPNM